MLSQRMGTQAKCLDPVRSKDECYPLLVIASLDFLALDKRATALYISVKTVGTHRMQLMKQLDIYDVAG